jgi:hypothetical protein
MVARIDLAECTISQEEVVVETDGTFTVGGKDSDGLLNANSLSGRFESSVTASGESSSHYFCEKRDISIYSIRAWDAKWLTGP